MKNIAIISISFLFFITAEGVFAQELFERPMNRPVKYSRPTLKTQSNTGIAYDMTPQSWYVWIDREGVVTSNGKSTSFLEQFFVVEESEDHLHIVKDNGSFNILSGKFDPLQKPVDYGWVLKNHLILWSSALYSDETTFRIKVLNVTDNSMIGQSIEKIMHGEKLIEYFNSPSTSQPNESRAKLEHIYYIYKKLDNRSLVGIKESLLRSNQNSIVGWVDNRMIHIWEHRVALEPSKVKDAVLERKYRNVRASVFANKADARAYITDPSSALTAVWDDDHFEKGYDTYWKRLPILSSQERVIQTVVYADAVKIFDCYDPMGIDSSNSALLCHLSKLINKYGGADFSDDGSQVVINSMFPKEFIELLLKMHYKFLVKGYTAHTIDILDKSIYDLVLFVDSDELNDLIDTLNKLTNPLIDASGRRKSLYNAFMQVLVVNFGVTIDDVKHFPLSKIMELITGIESTSVLLKRYTLDDIQDPITMNESGLDSVIEYIKGKRDLLQRIVPDGRYFFISNHRPYYWLPQDVLP